jgi:hypothetical protein
MRHFDRGWNPARLDLDRSDEVELQLGEVGEVVLGQSLPTDMRVDEPHTPQAGTPGPLPPEVGQEQALVVAHDDVLDTTAPVDDHADLPPQLDGYLGEEGCELEGDDLRGRYLSSVDPL